MLDLGELLLHIRTDTSEAESKVSGFADKAKGLLGTVGSGIGSAVAGGAKLIAEGTAAAAAGVAALTTASTASYASYE